MLELRRDVCALCGEEKDNCIELELEMRTLCEDCLNEEGYLYCDICDTYYSPMAELTRLRDGRTVCQCCLEALMEVSAITEEDIVE